MKGRTFAVALKILSMIFLILLVKVLGFGDLFNSNYPELVILFILAALVVLGWIFIISKTRNLNNRCSTPQGLKNCLRYHLCYKALMPSASVKGIFMF